MRVRDDADGQAARVGQVDADPAQHLRRRGDPSPGGRGQPQDIVRIGREERRAQKLGPAAAANDHARRAGISAAKVQLVLGAQRRREAERAGEDLGPPEVGFGELQPGQIVHFDHRVRGPSRMLSGERTLLAVQADVRVAVLDPSGHRPTSSSLMTISSVTSRSSVKPGCRNRQD